MAAHALLGPSGASRWLACPPSAIAELGYANTENRAAAEGTLAHDIGELMILSFLGRITSQKAAFEFEKLKQRKFENELMYSEEMLEYCKGYRAFVMEVYSQALAIDPNAQILIEQHFELTRWVPESFGRADIVIIAGHTLFVIDLKYGQGVRVEAKGNKQIRMYALGALSKLMVQFPHLQNVEMFIHQPRLKNFGRDTISTYELWQWAEEYVKPRAQKAFAGLGDYQAGEHCKFCRAKARCRTLSEYARTPAGSKEFADPNTLSDEEVAQIARTNPLLVSYSKDVTDYMLKKAVKEGKQWPGFKIVEGRSNRTITDEQAAIVKLVQAGYKEVYNIKIKNFGDLEAIIGAEHLTELLGKLIYKPEGKPTLVPNEDTRTSYHTAESEFKPIV